MAAHIFPNTVLVSGFQAFTSRHTLLRKFRGRTGHIKDIQFTNTLNEPKKAFIIYSHHSSIKLALQLHGTLVQGHELDVRVVDEWILCDHVPGEMVSLDDAFSDLQEVLHAVLVEKDEARSSYCAEVQRLNDLIAEMKDERRKPEDQRQVREKVEQALALQLTQARADVESTTVRCSQAQRESDVLRVRLTEVESRLETTQKLKASMEADMQNLHRRLQEASALQGKTSERLARAARENIKLEEELHLAKDAHSEALSSLRRVQSRLDDTSALAREAESYATQARTKRRRTEEWLTDEREAKRRLADDLEKSEARCQASAQQLEREVFEREVVEASLRTAMARREEELAQIKAKLDKVVVTDALLAAFLKMENWTIRTMDKVVVAP